MTEVQPQTPKKSRNGKAKAKANGGTEKSMESWIWNAACSIRGAQEAAKYKDFILPLIFVKRLCDVYDDELNRIAEKVNTREGVPAGEGR